MTDQNNAAQPVLTDQEILDLFHYGQTPYRIIKNGRAIETALLSKLRAEGVQAGDERESFSDWAWKKDGLAIGHMDGQAAAWEAWQERARRAALASAPVADEPVCQRCGGTGEADSGGTHPWGAPALIPCECTVSAPAADGTTFSVALRAIAEYPTPGEGSMSAANMREIARSALAGAKVAEKCPPPPLPPQPIAYREVESGVIKPRPRPTASAPVAKTLTRQNIFDRFQFLEGLVNAHWYTKIAEAAIAIYDEGRASAPVEGLPNVEPEPRTESDYPLTLGRYSAPVADGTTAKDVLRSILNAMQTSADGFDLADRLEHMRGSIERATSAPVAAKDQ